MSTTARGTGFGSTARATGMSSTARASSTPRPLFERLLDSRLLSVSSFISSASGMQIGTPFGSQSARDTRRHESSWSDDMPQAILFPANKPSSRADAQVLDQWVSTNFANYAQRFENSKFKDDSDEHLTKAVEELVPVLSIGLNEIVRQVSQHCLERGLVLEKIWRTYVDLFDRALSESRQALRKQKERTARSETELARIRAELGELKARHPEQLERLSQTLSGKFNQRQEELVQQLTNIRGESRALGVHFDEQFAKLESWFPLFPRYKDSRYKRSLPRNTDGRIVAGPPEMKLAADFKRILAALPADVRRRVGFFISSLLGYRARGVGSATTESLSERKDINSHKISQLEARLAELKAEEASRKSSKLEKRQTKASQEELPVAADE
eukprot:TRINITY_DN61158_c0_g1_i1.p1 TRINITY_DN61158_c0_g1~~TRINITY_DN61158_c0_g1_i1.p1  ORF type:complete len:412 (+),score=70.98 TRINITY_DN61158_c0_g1_i1:76-1236(+)